MKIKSFYTFLYNHHRRRSDSDMAWFYTFSSMGFLFTLNISSVVHIVFSDSTVFKEDTNFMILFMTPWAIHAMLSYILSEDLKKELFIKKSCSINKSKVRFLLWSYGILSFVIFFCTTLFFIPN